MLQDYLDCIAKHEASGKDLKTGELSKHTVDNKLYLIMKLLNNKFDKKFTIAEIARMLKEEKIPSARRLRIPKWYSDKWMQ